MGEYTTSFFKKTKDMKENNNKLVTFFTKSLKETYIFANHHAPSVLALLRNILKSFRKPWMAAKAAMYRNPVTQPVLKQSTWLPLVLILVGGVVLMYKDLNFNFNLTSSGGGAGLVNSASSGVASQAVSYEGGVLFSENQAQKNKRYIQTYSSLAVSEMNAYGIPASVKLGLALIESQAGERSAATLYNNHFAIKCFSRKCKKGHCGNLEEAGHKSFFRKYENIENGWRAHSLMLTTGKYRDLAKVKNYQTWATALLEKGYFETQSQAKQLISVIESYRLNQLDK